jgi:cytochrome c oxidase subunit I+III
MSRPPPSETGFDRRKLDQFPIRTPRPEGEREALRRAWARPKGWAGRFTVVSNNYIGVYLVAASFLFFCLAGVLALLIRTQLALPGNDFLSQETYNQVFTMHGTVMMFLFAVPAVEAVAVLLLPQMLGARELPFPRLGAYAFWAYFAGGLAFFCSLFAGLAPDGGWFLYPPLTSIAYSPGINVDFWLLGIGFIEIAAIAGAIEIIVGVLRYRAPGMSLDRMPVFAWAMLAFAVMVIIGFPGVILGSTLLELERALNWPFFDPTRGGDPLLWQHLFWFFGHPDVYIIFLPAAGMLSMILPTVVKAPLIGWRLVVLAIIATTFLSFGVWAHHMYTTGLPGLSVSFFSAASMAVSVPAGVQVFAWIATAMTGRYRFNTPGLFALGSLIIFTMGGLTGVMVGLVPFDWQAHDSYFIVAHLHYVLIGGMVFPFMAALYYWAPAVSRQPLSEGLGRWVFWLMFAGTHITFLPMHLTGLMGMPRRVYTYLPEMNWVWPNLVSTFGAFLIGLGVLVFLADLARRFRFSATDNPGNVFDAGTLEWLPNGLYAARSIPVVRSRYPLWDDPDLARDVDEGYYLLPGTITGHRESLVTSPIRAEPQYLQVVPGPSVWHVWAALLTAAAFLLATVQAHMAGLVCGGLAIGAILVWAWQADHRVEPETADIGGGIIVPTYVSGVWSHGWWAMCALLAVILMIFLLGMFSYVFLWSRHPGLWIPPPGQAWLSAILGAGLAGAAAAAAAPRVLARAGRIGAALSALLVSFSAACLGLAFWADLHSWWAEGLRPELTSQGAIIFGLGVLNGVLLATAVIMALFICARTIAGRLTRQVPASLEVISLFLVYACFQASAGAALARLFPGS